MLNLRSLRDLPKVIAALVVITCILLPGIFIVVWKTDTFVSESKRIESRFLTQSKMALKERLLNVLTLVRTKQAVMEASARAKIKNDVTDIHAVLSQMHGEWRTATDDGHRRQMLLSNIQALAAGHAKGQLLVLDQSGTLVYPQTGMIPLWDDFRNLVDEDGNRMIDRIVAVVNRFDDLYQNFSSNGTAHAETFEKVGYFKLFQPTGWILGVGGPGGD